MIDVSLGNFPLQPTREARLRSGLKNRKFERHASILADGERGRK
jgi:hypothetical protein